MFNVKKALIPYPKDVSVTEGSCKVDGIKISTPPYDNDVFCEAVKLIKNKAGEGNYPVEIKISEVCDNKAEAYTLEIGPRGAFICANDFGGAYYAAVTLTQLLHKKDDTQYLPFVKISDYPDFYDRGLLLENRYGSDFMTLEDYKAAIDYLSQMKYNQLTIGVYGCWCVQYDMRLSEFLYIPLKNHPELNTPRDIRYWSPKENKYIIRENVLPVMFEEDYFDALIKYAATKNIKIKPLFNSFGHNTLIPRLHPELSAKDENGNPTKHGFCVSDDAVYDFMFSIYDEIIDRYLTPNGLDSIEIGLDEVYAWLGEDLDDIYGRFEPYCRCEKCRSMERKDLMLHYIIRVCKYLKGKGMKNVYIYHDMLFEIFDIVNEELVNLFKEEGIYDIVVLDWWYYTKEEDVFQKREINGLFRSITKPFTGYYHWVIPMEYNNNIYALAKLAKKHGFEGIESYSSFEYCFDRPFMYQAELSWNIDKLEEYDDFLTRYASVRFPNNSDEAKKVLDIMAKLTTNDTVVNMMNGLEYYWYTYVAEKEPYPRNFHGSVYSKIDSDRENYLPYFESVKENAKTAMSFFENEDTPMAKVWYAIAMHYYTYADAYSAIIRLYDNYNDGSISADNVIDELKELLKRHEEFMAVVEDTRIKANGYLYLRNHSITRQLYLDLIAYFEMGKQKGEKPVFKIDNFDYCISDEYNKLR